jgi:hypothetical protein
MIIKFATAILLLTLYSWRKTVTPVSDTTSFLQPLKKQLEPVLPCYDSITLDTAFVSETGNQMYLQFAFTGYCPEQKFLIIQVSDDVSITAGCIASIHLIDHGISRTISLQEMNREYVLWDAAITKSFVEQDASVTAALQPLVLTDGWKVLPVVILVASKLRTTGASYYYLSTLLSSCGGAFLSKSLAQDFTSLT